MGLYDTYLAETGGKTASTGELYSLYLAEKTPQPSTFNKVVGAVKNYAQESVDQVIPFGNAFLHPIDTLSKIGNRFLENFSGGIKKGGEALAGIFQDKGMANKVADTANLISGTAQSFFSPITGAFDISTHTPILKQAADAINVIPTGIGFVGSWGTGKAVDWLKNFGVSEEAINTIKAPLQEVGSLTAQILLGGKIMEKIGVATKNKQEITPEVATNIVNEAKTATANHPAITTPAKPLFDQYKAEVASKNAPVAPESANPLSQEALKYKSAEEFVKAQTTSNSWSEAQKTNPDLWNKGILRRSISPVGAEGVIPKDVHTIQAKWQNYGQNSDIPADVVYERINSGAFKGEYVDKQGNPIRDANGSILQDTYNESTGQYDVPTIPNEQLKNNLIDSFSTKEGKDYLNNVVKALPKNPDGTVTAYRIGSIGEGAQSYTLSEGMAKTFSNQGTDIPLPGTPGLPKGGYKDFGALPANMVKIDPKGIKAWSPYDAEILVEPKYVQTKSQLTDIYNKAKEQPVETKGTTPSGLAKSIEQKAVEAKLTEGFANVAGYDASTIKEQAKLSSDLINSGIDNARAVVRGDVPLPKDLRGSSLIVAMEDYLKKNPNGEIAHELANSPLTSAVSQAGSELGLMQNRVQDSLTAQFRDIKKAREAIIEKKGGVKKAVKSTVDEIKTEIKKTASKRPSWEEFINEITCK